MERDIALIKAGKYQDPKEEEQSKDDPKPNFGDFGFEDIDKIKEHIKATSKKRGEAKKFLTEIDEKLNLLKSKIRKHEKKEGEMDNRPFREVRRKLLKARRKLEKKKLETKEKEKKLTEQIDKLKKIKNKIEGNLS